MSGGIANEMYLSDGEAHAGDARLQQRIWEELRWESSLHAADLRVDVQDRVARLWGTVPFFYEKVLAEHAADRASGVVHVINEVEIAPAAADRWSDAQLRAAVEDVLAWNALVPTGGVQATVTDGVVQLRGRVVGEDQRLAAYEAVARLRGVRDVRDHIQVGWTSGAIDLDKRVSAALARDAALRDSRIQVEVHGAAVTLHGRVHTLAEREEADRAARRVPGVAHVTDDLEVK